MPSFLAELRRRNVFKVSVAYTILSWMLIRMVSALTPALGTGDRVIQIFTLLLILCFPVIVLFAWAYEFTPEGFKLTSNVEKTNSITAETGRKLNYLLLALVALAMAVFIVENFL